LHISVQNIKDKDELTEIKLKKYCLLFISAVILLSCSGTDKKNTYQGERFSFSDSTLVLNKSADEIDRSTTYEIFFSLEKSVKCITVNIEAVYIADTFPAERIPQKTYFIVEKIINTKKYKSKKDITYTPLARNFNDEWDTFYPVQICGLEGDPLSSIDASDYRIRFTVFDSRPVIFMATVFSDEKITFRK
jgi:hypothetical protein